MREISRVYIGETGSEGKPTPQPLEHEVMNQSFQADIYEQIMRENQQSIYIRRDGKCGQTKTTTTAT